MLGFKELNPKFSIRKAGTGTRLPSSSTCVNLLKLPAYSDEDTLREYVISFSFLNKLHIKLTKLLLYNLGNYTMPLMQMLGLTYLKKRIQYFDKIYYLC